MIKRILKWTGLILLFLIAGITIVTAFRQNIKYEAPYPAIKASKDSLVIATGKHLVFGAAHCVDCHNTANVDSLINLGQPVDLSGGREFSLPLGNIYSKNITPDKETGIGNYTDEQIARALRYGVHPDGTVVYDFMPFHNMSDEDLTAVISYLRAQRPVKNMVPRHDLNVMGNLVKAFMVKPVGPTGEVPKAVQKDTSAAYGRYIAMSVLNVMVATQCVIWQEDLPANPLPAVDLLKNPVCQLYIRQTLHQIQPAGYLDGQKMILSNASEWAR